MLLLSLETSYGLGGFPVGEVAALTAAFLWAAATLMFGRIGKVLSPLMLNIVKGIIAIAFLFITIAVRPLSVEAIALDTSAITAVPVSTHGGAHLSFQGVSVLAIFQLVLSGGIGIGLGDTAYFAAINILGAQRALLLETLAPPMSAVFAWIFLSEQLPTMAVAGIVLTLLGIAWVISETPKESPRQRPPQGTQYLAPQQLKKGLSIALLAVFCQASGAVLSRAALLEVSVDPLWSSLIRLSAGMAFMVGLAAIQPWRLGDYRGQSSNHQKAAAVPTAAVPKATVPTATVPTAAVPTVKQAGLLPEAGAKTNWKTRWHHSLAALQRPKLLFTVVLAAFFGTYLGIWLQQIALKYTAAGIAQSLLATSPLFVLPMAALLGDRISWRAISGVAIALSGIWLLFS